LSDTLEIIDPYLLLIEPAVTDASRFAQELLHLRKWTSERENPPKLLLELVNAMYNEGVYPTRDAVNSLLLTKEVKFVSTKELLSLLSAIQKAHLASTEECLGLKSICLTESDPELSTNFFGDRLPRDTRRCFEETLAAIAVGGKLKSISNASLLSDSQATTEELGVKINQSFLSDPAIELTLPVDAIIEISKVGTTHKATPRNILESVNIAANNSCKNVIFLNSAFDSAAESPYKQPIKVLYALEAIKDLSVQISGTVENTKSVQSWQDFFAERGLIYKPQESDTTKGKWGSEYEVVFEGKKVSIEKHIALGKGGPDTCLRIYFHFQETTQRFIIAHVGRHKTNTRT